MLLYSHSHSTPHLVNKVAASPYRVCSHTARHPRHPPPKTRSNSCATTAISLPAPMHHIALLSLPQKEHKTYTVADNHYHHLLLLVHYSEKIILDVLHIFTCHRFRLLR